MSALFGQFGHGNPLSTPIGQLIEQATDGSQASENWGLYMEVCDMINETEDGPKDGIRAIKKRLSQNVGKNYTAVMYTLTSLETCVKNCGKRFHVQVANKDFLHDLVKIIGPKNDPPTVIQEKVLSMIQSWADAFRGTPDLKEVEKVYQELKAKGIEFPMTDLDSLAPIHTPAMVQGEIDQTATRTRSPSSRTSQVPRTQQPQMPPPPVTHASGPVLPSQEQLAKLRSELDIVQGNNRVLGEMLTELSPASVEPSDLELLHELNRTCRSMQQRIVELIESVANDEVTNELLRVNDELNNVFLRYDRFEKYRTDQSGKTSDPAESDITYNSHAPPSYDQIQASSDPQVGMLIDIGDGGGTQTTSTQPPVNQQFANMSLGSTNSAAASSHQPQTVKPGSGLDEDFDMFAQSRKSFDQNKQTLSQGAYSNQSEDQRQGIGLGPAVNAKSSATGKETDFDEMERWLKDEKTNNGKSAESVTSSEFDNFLADRAAAAERLPSISAATGSQNAQQSSRRQLQKDDEESPLFAL